MTGARFTAYALALVVWAIILAFRRAPTLWKGRSLLWFNTVIFAATAANQIADGISADPGLIAFEAFLLVSGALASELWLLLHIDRAAIQAVLEKCFEKTRARHEHSHSGYVVAAGGEQLKIALTPMGGATRIRFSGAKTSKKAELIKSVFSKQFKTSFPRPRFRT